MSIAAKRKKAVTLYKTAEITSQENRKDQIAKLIFLRTKNPTQPHLNPQQTTGVNLGAAVLL